MKANRISLTFVLSLLILKGITQKTESNLSTSKGIQFVHNLSWEQVKAKAREENKYIFLDCFASWCGPCKKMDIEIYPNRNIGNIVNDQFISVKVQMDTSKNDTEQEKRWYADAHSLMVGYKIYAYPSFLFFTPDGKIVHKGLGYKNEKQFISMLSDAINPSRQYFTILKKYENGEKGNSDMLVLIQTAQELNDNFILQEVGTDYAKNYLSHLSDTEMLNKNNIILLSQFIKNSKEVGFDLFIRHATQVDSIMNRVGYSRNFVDGIIYIEEVKNRIDSAKKSDVEPEWEGMIKNIARKYNMDYANRVVARNRVIWYKWKKDWKNYTKWIVKLNENYMPLNYIEDSYYINGCAWEVFLKSNSRRELRCTSKWVKEILDNKNNPYHNEGFIMDTYANLQFKLHHTAEALKWEEKATKADPTNEEIQRVLSKMKSACQKK